MVAVPEEVAAEVFRLFHAISKSRINRDLADAADNFEKYWDRMMSVFDLTKEAYTPETYAENLHHAMLCAFAANAVSNTPNDIAYHLAGSSARGAAKVALQIARKTGELARLGGEIEANSGDPEYVEELQENVDRIVSQIEQMMVGDVLRRYRLNRMADEFETDEAAFDKRVAAGHELIYQRLRAMNRKRSA
jgi:hypothetical protein